MGKTLVEKIISNHIVEGDLIRGSKIKIKIDQTLTQDATGTMAYLELESMGIDKVKTEISVSYVDHNTLQTGFENADDHIYLQSVADKYGIYFSRVGNGICHQVHLERFSHPGKTLLGSDSHTPTCGGAGMLAIGAGGLDVACAMAGRPFTLIMPHIIKVELKNKLRNGVSAKDIILEVLRLITVKGGVNKVVEYVGDGVSTLSVPERSTITNMGAELGATSSIFPSDDETKKFFKMQDRMDDFQYLYPDSDAIYDEEYIIDLSSLEPLAAKPFSPDNIDTIENLAGISVDQILIGSCTNSSYLDLMKVASILKGKKVHPNVSLGIACGSRQVMTMICKNGILQDFIDAGARILETTCGACIGMGQAPKTESVSLRTFNRNFYGRSGTKSANVYLVSPEVAAISAITGVVTTPFNNYEEKYAMPERFDIDDSMIIAPTFGDHIKRGPNILPLPVFSKLDDVITKNVVIKVEDNITTDHIMPAGSNVLPYRSNIEKISEFVFHQIKSDFKEICKKHNGGIIVAGENYGQGSSREHAALAPNYLGIKAVIAKSYARIHQQNLINFGILPFTFYDALDYSNVHEYDELEIKLENTKIMKAFNKNTGLTFHIKLDLTTEEMEIMKLGGLLNYIKEGL